MTARVNITVNPGADRLVSENPLALLIGMLLDQQVAMETAFAGPAKIKDRLGAFDAKTLAGQDPEWLGRVCKTKRTAKAAAKSAAKDCLEGRGLSDT